MSTPKPPSGAGAQPAAGGLILERAGGEFWNRPVAGEHAFEIRANNGRRRSKLERYFPADDSTSKRRSGPASSGA